MSHRDTIYVCVHTHIIYIYISRSINNTSFEQTNSFNARLQHINIGNFKANDLIALSICLPGC